MKSLLPHIVFCVAELNDHAVEPRSVMSRCGNSHFVVVRPVEPGVGSNSDTTAEDSTPRIPLYSTTSLALLGYSSSSQRWPYYSLLHLLLLCVCRVWVLLVLSARRNPSWRTETRDMRFHLSSTQHFLCFSQRNPSLVLAFQEEVASTTASTVSTRSSRRGSKGKYRKKNWQGKRASHQLRGVSGAAPAVIQGSK